MPTALLVVVGLLLVVPALALILLHIAYSRRPATLWKRRVQAAVAEWEQRKQGLTTPSDSSPEARDLALRGQYFARHLQGISVDHLLNYSGIGPVSVSRLRDAGFSNLDELARGNFASVPGLGPAREKDLREALQRADQEAKSQFDAGACPAAVAMLEEKKAQKAERTRQHEEAREHLKEVEAALAYLAEPRRVAEQVSFPQFIFRNRVTGLTEKLSGRSLSPPPFLRIAKPVPVEPQPVAVALPAPIDESPLDRLRAVASFGYAIAKVDGRIAVGERRQIRAFLEHRYGSAADLRTRMDSIVEEVETNALGLDQAIAAVCRTIPASEFAELHRFAISVVDASGQRSTREDQCLARIAEALDIESQTSKPVATAQPESTGTWTEVECRTMLEIRLDTPLSVEWIRRQFYLLADRFAPAKFSDHGTEFVSMAATKRANVERAAKQLLAAFNEPLETPIAEQPTELRHNPDLDAVFG
ncbi:MAG: hypothetical protein EXS09_18090 [Gemmataceae bacterium]|nr:hypothetical protein [Gemmataceae bacterium]